MEEGKLSNRICPPDMTVEEWQVALRREAAQKSDFIIQHLDDNKIWGDYVVSHGESKYKVAFRGVCSPDNYCSCLDFRTSGLGTCKHIEAVILKLRREEEGYPWGNLRYVPLYSSIYVSYKGGRKIRFSLGLNEKALFESFQRKYFGEENVLKKEFYAEIDDICDEASSIDDNFRCYEDVYDHIDSVLGKQRWIETIERTFPEKKVNTAYARTSHSQEYLEEMYQLLHIGNGIIVSDNNLSLYREIIALMEIVLRIEESPALIIATSVHRAEEWQTLINRSPLAKSRRLFIASKEQFRFSARLPSGVFSFVYIEDADYLKDWNNPISRCIKRLTIKHLYLNLTKLSKFTPVQFSSIVQHISPYLLAPFYQFIRIYKDAFPLSDTGDNFPKESREFLFVRNKTRNIVWPDDQLPLSFSSASNDVKKFLSHAVELIENEETRNILIKVLKKLISSHD